MRRGIRAIAVTAIVVGACVATPGVSQAYVMLPLSGCTTDGVASSTRTTSQTVYPCQASRARLDKYVSYYPTSYYGNWEPYGSESDTGTVTVGTWVKNCFQDQLHGGGYTECYSVTD